jgi:ribonucleoside-diphosphate reductase alpha chain
MAKTIYDKLSEERKNLQAAGLVPEWYTTAGWQMFKEKYMYEASNVKEQFERIANTAAKHLRKIDQEELGRKKFFELLWNGWMSPSTPVLSNMGTDRGLPIACSGGRIGDSVYDFYAARLETAILTKMGFGTSGYFGDVRPRGSSISVGGKASGMVPVWQGFIDDMRKITQGQARRGSFAAYLPIDHGDFDEAADYTMAETDDANIGWVIKKSFIDDLNEGFPEATRRFQKSLKLKMTMGKGYYCFIDKINDKRPPMYVKHGLYVNASNLCDEITLFSDADHTFTCVLSSMNVSKWEEWKDTDAVFWATVFLDCVVEEFLEKARKIPGLEKAVRFTEKGRALGLGQCGYHTLLQKKRIPVEDMRAYFLNREIAKHINEESLRASQHMATLLGEPLWCEGFGVRNTHRIAIAPTKSTALLMGGVSEGINLDPAVIYTQTTAAGEVARIVPEFLEYMKEKGMYNKAVIKRILEARGSVQNEDWIPDEDKSVFKTAFEINQEAHIRQASQRAPYLCQWQSFNLSFSAEEDPAWIGHCHQMIFEDPNMLGAYYITTQSGVTGSKECESCQ